MKSFLHRVKCLFFGSFILVNLGLFAQIPTSSMQLWLRADSGVILSGSQVTQWNDISGHGRNAIQATATQRPTYIASEPVLQGKPVIRFDGSNDFMQFPRIDSIRSFFFVIKHNTGVQDKASILGISAPPVYFLGGDGSFLFGSASLSMINGSYAVNMTPSAYASMRKPTQYSIISGRTADNVVAEYISNDRNTAGRYWNGNIVEIIVYADSLIDSDRLIVESYLNNKYGSRVNITPDSVFTNMLCDTTITNLNTGLDSLVWSTGDSGNTTLTDGSGLYFLSGKNVFNVISVDTAVIVLSNINANKFSDTAICIGDTVFFDAEVSGGSYDYLWSTGNTTPLLGIYQGGTYTCQITDSLGCTAHYDSFYVTMDSFSLISLFSGDTSVCVGNVISSNLLPAGGNYLWSTGDTSNEITISTSGNYWLVITDINGCTNSDSINIAISGVAPNVSSLVSGFCYGESTSFIDVSTAITPESIANRHWEFSDLYTSTDSVVSHTFLSTGMFTYTLTVVSDSGCTSTVMDTIQILANPFVGIFETDTICLSGSSLFVDSIYVDSNDSLVDILWHLPDGSIISGDTISYIPSTIGNNTLWVELTTLYSCLSFDTLVLAVVASLPRAETPIIYCPRDNYTISDSAVWIKWTASANATSYLIEASTDGFMTLTYLAATNNEEGAVSLQNGNNQIRVVALNACGDSSISSEIAINRISNSLFSSCLMWLSADSNLVLSGARVTQWRDKSFHGRNAVQGTTTNQPQFTASNYPIKNNPSISFDGSNDFMSFAITDSIKTIVLLIKHNSGFQTKASALGIDAPPVYFLGGDANLMFGSTSSVMTEGRLYYNGNDTSIASLLKPTEFSLISGCLAGFASAQYISNDRNTAGRYWDGDYAEIMLFSDSLNDNDRTLIENYLFTKYGAHPCNPPLIEVPYGFCDTFINVPGYYKSIEWNDGSSDSFKIVNNSGTYSYCAINIFDQEYCDTVQVQYPGTVHSFGDTVALCLGDTFRTNTNLNTAYYMHYLNGVLVDSNLIIANPGQNVLEIQDTNGCTYVDSFFVIIDSTAVLNYLENDTTLCIGNSLQVQYNNYPTNSYLWSTGTSGDAMTVPGSGNFWLSVTSANACHASDSITILTVGRAPDVYFDVDGVCIGDTTQMSDLSIVYAPETISSWLWSFSDGDTSFLQNPEKVFAASGTYSARLVVTTDSGCSNYFDKTIEIFNLPIAFFNETVICADAPFTIANSSSAPLGDSLIAFAWTVNGTTVSTSKNFNEELSSTGVNQIGLQVITTHGCSDTYSDSLEVFPPLLPDFEFTNNCGNQAVQFTNTTPTLSVVYNNWDFGTGISTTVAAPSYTFPDTGTYQVSLEIINTLGCTDTISKRVTVYPSPWLSLGDTTVCEKNSLTLTALYSLFGDEITSINWIANGQTFNSLNPTIRFDTIGVYPIICSLRTLAGCSATDTANVIVNSGPNANFSYIPLYSEAPIDITFNNLSSGGGNYIWDFGNGNSSTDVNPTNHYTENGEYNVVLVANNGPACSDTVRKTIILEHADLDLWVERVVYELHDAGNGSAEIVFGVRLINVGSRNITSAKLIVQTEDGNYFQEDWNGDLAPGSSTMYTFNSKIYLPNNATSKKLCVHAIKVNEGDEETNLANNEQCAAVNNDVIVSNVYPNPANDIAYIDVVLKKEIALSVALYDDIGRICTPEQQIIGLIGLNTIQINAKALRAGEYFIRLKYNDEEQVIKLQTK